MLSEQEKNELHKKWDAFENSQPNEIKIDKAGPNGEDVILRKTKIRGITVYTAPFKTSSLFDFSSPRKKRLCTAG